MILDHFDYIPQNQAVTVIKSGYFILKMDTNKPDYGLIYKNNMWHDQEEWVGGQRYCFWDIGKNSVKILLFYIVFSMDKWFITL